jgi:hypothetical protein
MDLPFNFRRAYLSLPYQRYLSRIQFHFAHHVNSKLNIDLIVVAPTRHLLLFSDDFRSTLLWPIYFICNFQEIMYYNPLNIIICVLTSFSHLQMCTVLEVRQLHLFQQFSVISASPSKHYSMQQKSLKFWPCSVWPGISSWQCTESKQLSPVLG